MSEDKLNSLLEYVRSDGRICPMPPQWVELYEMLPDKQRVGNSWEPPPPLILAAWHFPHLPKQIRLEEHIRYAYEHGVLDEVNRYLRSLSTEQWFFE